MSIHTNTHSSGSV